MKKTFLTAFVCIAAFAVIPAKAGITDVPDHVLMDFVFENYKSTGDFVNPIVGLYVWPEGEKESETNRLAAPVFFGHSTSLRFTVSSSASSFIIKIVRQNHAYITLGANLPAIKKLRIDDDPADMFELQYRNGQTECTSYWDFGFDYSSESESPIVPHVSNRSPLGYPNTTVSPTPSPSHPIRLGNANATVTPTPSAAHPVRLGNTNATVTPAPSAAHPFQIRNADAIVSPTPSASPVRRLGTLQEPTSSQTPTATLTPNVSNDAARAFDRGNAAVDKGDYQTAINQYSEAIRLKPDLVNAFFNRGASYQGLKQYDKAIQDYSEAVRLEPKYVNAFYYRGNAYCGLGKYDKAIDDYSEVIRLAPNSGLGFAGRGTAYFQLKEYDKAFKDYSEAIRVEPNSALGFYSRAIAHGQLKEYDKAIDDYTEAIRLAPEADRLMSLFYRGFNYYQLKKYDKAIDDYSEAIRLAPDFAPAYRDRAICYDAIGKKDAAERDRATAQELVKANPSPSASPGS